MLPTVDGWKIEVVLPPQAVDSFVQAFEPLCTAVASFEVEEHRLWRVEGYALAPPSSELLTAAVAIAASRAGIAEPDVICLPLPIIDWVSETQRNFQPLRAGRYFIRPSHYEGRAPSATIPITVDAGAAFGTGEHATTKGCLLALDGLARAKRFTNLLDLGCGSGILAMAAAMTWRVRVIAADIDPSAVAVARENARLNRLTRFIYTVRSEGFSAPELRRGAPYDLIIANILARPLVTLAYPIRQHLAADGICVLSGLLAHQESQVSAAFRLQGIRLIKRIAIDGWHTLIVGK